MIIFFSILQSDIWNNGNLNQRPERDAKNMILLTWILITSEVSLPIVTFSLILLISPPDKVKFGEVAKAPPRLSIKPRGSEKKTNKKVLVESRTTLALKNPDGEAKSQVIGLKCKQLLEEDRIRAIKEYRLSKLKQRTQHKNFIS